MIGEFIYEYIEGMVGEEKAPKITGMLLDLPSTEIVAYLKNYQHFNEKVQEALELVSK